MERRKTKSEAGAARGRWEEEMEEERREVDVRMRDLRESIKRLRLEGAGASEVELEEARAEGDRKVEELKGEFEAERRMWEAEREEAGKTLEGLRAEMEAELASVRAELAGRDAELASVRAELAGRDAGSVDDSRNRIAERVKEVVSLAYFEVEEAVGGREEGLQGDVVLEIVMGALKGATSQALAGGGGEEEEEEEEEEEIFEEGDGGVDDVVAQDEREGRGEGGDADFLENGVAGAGLDEVGDDEVEAKVESRGKKKKKKSKAQGHTI